jgi:hypothetical protein
MVSAPEARHHAILFACVTWAVSLVTTFAGPGRTSLAGVVNGPDFVYYYTLGHLAREGRIATAYDGAASHAAQSALIPESADAFHAPVYPPQAALIFMPFSRLTFEHALAAWTLVTIGLYLLFVWYAWRVARDQLPDATLVFAAAIGFPPFWQTVMNGQGTILILGSFFLAWLALERKWHFLAGAALGLLAIKPQFGLPFATIVIVRREWRMLAGAAASVAAQSLAVWWVLGADAFSGFAGALPAILAQADALEPKPYQTHSLRALTRLLPNWVGLPVWLALVALVLWKTTRAWATGAPVTVRLGLAMLASVLVSPHMIGYDAAVLVLPFIWFGAWLVEQREGLELQKYGSLLYGIFLTIFIPTAVFLRVQVSVPLMLWLFWLMERQVRAADAPR